jgi:hypothetical protein
VELVAVDPVEWTPQNEGSMKGSRSRTPCLTYRACSALSPRTGRDPTGFGVGPGIAHPILVDDGGSGKTEEPEKPFLPQS